MENFQKIIVYGSAKISTSNQSTIRVLADLVAKAIRMSDVIFLIPKRNLKAEIIKAYTNRKEKNKLAYA